MRDEPKERLRRIRRPVYLFLIELENLQVLVFVGSGKPEKPDKNPRSEDEKQQQTQPTYDAGSGNNGGKRVFSPPQGLQ